jgi:putative chitinase
MVDLMRLSGVLLPHIIKELGEVATRFQINSPLRASHFLAQAHHESAGFTRTVENLNYSAVRLIQVFPKYFDGTNAEEYSGKPESIASRVYADRMGNGDEASKDGWKFRGRGYMQLTGRDNYQSFDLIVPEDVVANPELVQTQYPLLSAGWFWNSRGLNGLADQGPTHSVADAITKKINGGTNGREDRVKWFDYYYEKLEDG